MIYKNLLMQKAENIVTITLNRPTRFNTLDDEVWYEMLAVADEIRNMEDALAVIIKGAGKLFSAGIDLKFLEKINSSYVMDKITMFQSVYSQWEELSQPVIAQIHGICYGSALELALACDIRIASYDTHFSIPEVRFGLAPDMGGITRLTKLVGPGQAKRLILACEEIDAQEAKSIGLVDIIVDPEQLNERTLSLAKSIAEKPRAAVMFAKKGVNLALESSRMAGLLFEQAQSMYCCGTSDQKEAIGAYFEKRKPNFQGC